MTLSSASFVAALLAALILQADLGAAQAQVPACSLNCTLAILEPAGCSVTDVASVRDCLCSNNTLQLALTNCAFAACNQTDQIAASDFLQNDICEGVPHDSRKTEILLVEILLAVFVFPMVALRLTSRIWITGRVWWDDWMIIICALFMVPNTVIPIYTVHLGFGVHIWNVPAANVVKLNLLYWIASIFYALIQNTAKFSILFFYLRIFPTPSFRRIVNIALVWQLCHMIAFTMIVILQCLPVEAFWELSMQRKCLDINAATKAGQFASIIEDLIIMVLPISELKGLNLNLRKRIALCFMFAIGSFACITSMIRLKYVWNYQLALDGTWTYINIVLWSDIETYVAVICSCLMCTRPFIVKVCPRLFPSTTASNSTKRTSSREKSWSRFLSPLSPKIWSSKLKLSAGSSTMTRLDEERGGVESDSANTIIIQGNKGSERNLPGIEVRTSIEMDERGQSPSTMERSDSRNAASEEEFVCHHGLGTQ